MDAASLIDTLDAEVAGDLLAGRQPERDARHDRLRAGVPRLRGRAAARLHAPVQHHRGQPARGPRRRPAAGRRHPPGRPQAPALRQAAPRASPATPSPPSRASTGSSTRPAQSNDLIELTRLQDPLAQIGVGPVDRNGASRPGALPASADSLKNSLNQVSTLRAYAPELTGWFDDFGHSGFPDAFGGIGRISTTLNTFSAGRPRPGSPATTSSRSSSSARRPASASRSTRPSYPVARHQGPPALPRLQRARPRPSDQLTQGGTVDCDPSRDPARPMKRLATHTRPDRGGPGRPRHRRGRVRGATPTRPSSSTPSVSSRARSSASPARRPGTITDLDITPQKTALVSFEVDSGFPEFKADASCSSEPQSLIAEYFLDCQPGTSTQPLDGPIPAARNKTTVQPDLAQNTLREPFKDRLAAPDQRVRNRARRQRREPERGDPRRRPGPPAAQAGAQHPRQAEHDDRRAQHERGRDLRSSSPTAGRTSSTSSTTPGGPRRSRPSARTTCRRTSTCSTTSSPSSSRRWSSSATWPCSRRRCSPTCTPRRPGSTSWPRNLPRFQQRRPSSRSPRSAGRPISARPPSPTARRRSQHSTRPARRPTPPLNQVAQFLESISDPKQRGRGGLPAPATTSASSRGGGPAGPGARPEARHHSARRPDRHLQVGQWHAVRLERDRRQPRLHRNGGPPQLRLRPDELAEPLRPARPRARDHAGQRAGHQPACGYQTGPDRPRGGRRSDDRPEELRRVRGHPGRQASPASTTAPIPRACSGTSAATTRASARTAAPSRPSATPPTRRHTTAGLTSATTAAAAQVGPTAAASADAGAAKGDRQDPQGRRPEQDPGRRQEEAPGPAAGGSAAAAAPAPATAAARPRDWA